MAKLSGITTTLTIQDSGAVARDVSNDVGDISLPITFGLQDVTGLDKSAVERLALLTDLKAAIKGYHNNASNRLHPVVSTGQTTPRQIVCTLPGGAGATLTFTALLDNYTISRAQSGALTNSISASLSSGTAPAWS